MANEKRLIDANALRKRMFSYYSCVDENSSKKYYKGETLMSYEVADMIEDCIDNAPTVEAVEVVRCKDCKCWTECESSLLGKVMCCTGQGSAYIQKAEDDFCSYGERREGE